MTDCTTRSNALGSRCCECREPHPFGRRTARQNDGRRHPGHSAERHVGRGRGSQTHSEWNAAHDGANQIWVDARASGRENPSGIGLRRWSGRAEAHRRSADCRSRYGTFFAPMRAVSQFDFRIERVAGKQIGTPGPAGLRDPRIDLVLRLGGGRSGRRGS